MVEIKQQQQQQHGNNKDNLLQGCFIVIQKVYITVTVWIQEQAGRDQFHCIRSVFWML